MTVPDMHLPPLEGNHVKQHGGSSMHRAILFGALVAVATVGYTVSRHALSPESLLMDHHAGHDTGHMMAGDTPAKVEGRPVTTFKPISCQKLPNAPGKSLTIALVEFPPNAYTPRHRHPASVTAYVIKGTLRSQLEGEPSGTYTIGQSWFEPPGAIHLFAENVSKTEPAEILATFVADDDCGPLTIPD